MGGHTRGFEWDDQSSAKLTLLWAEGHSCSEIGRRMNVSKNAVVGKVGRLGLPKRENPVRKRPEGVAKPPAKPRRLKRPVIAAAEAPVENFAVVRGKSEPCCWPMGDPRARGFRYCDAPGVPGASYCAAHKRLSSADAMASAKWRGLQAWWAEMVR
jgi:GcrA cell cycle regulator